MKNLVELTGTDARSYPFRVRPRDRSAEPSWLTESPGLFLLLLRSGDCRIQLPSYRVQEVRLTTDLLGTYREFVASGRQAPRRLLPFGRKPEAPVDKYAASTDIGLYPCDSIREARIAHDAILDCYGTESIRFPDLRIAS
ncbi:hypothetical protein HKCCE2091_07895 [Rhodobacterales bacterium HKCCE2091]|nr:hypothetical protein [Rhodobacterales bacterium HKCCE2091]